MKLTDNIQGSMELEEKGTRSDHIYNMVALVCALVAAALELSSLIAFLIYNTAGFRLWSIFFYPMLIAIIGAFFFSTSELFRNRYFKSLLAFLIASIVTVIAVIFIVVQAVVYKQVYIIPFIYFSNGSIPPPGSTPGLLALLGF